jgi:hypothetical protein
VGNFVAIDVGLGLVGAGGETDGRENTGLLVGFFVGLVDAGARVVGFTVGRVVVDGFEVGVLDGWFGLGVEAGVGIADEVGVGVGVMVGWTIEWSCG